MNAFGDRGRPVTLLCFEPLVASELEESSLVLRLIQYNALFQFPSSFIRAFRGEQGNKMEISESVNVSFCTPKYEIGEDLVSTISVSLKWGGNWLGGRLGHMPAYTWRRSRFW